MAGLGLARLCSAMLLRDAMAPQYQIVETQNNTLHTEPKNYIRILAQAYCPQAQYINDDGAHHDADVDDDYGVLCYAML